MQNRTTGTTNFRNNIARLWPEFELWYLSDEGGQKKTCADGRARFAHVVQRDNELYAWGSQITDWSVPDYCAVAENHQKINAWKNSRESAAKALKKVQDQSVDTHFQTSRLSSVEWEQEQGPLRQMHMKRSYPTFTCLPGAQPPSLGYGLGQGATMPEKLASGSGYNMIRNMKRDEAREDKMPWEQQTEAYTLSRRLELKMVNVDAALPFGTVPQQKVCAELPQTQADFVHGPWPKQQVFLIDKTHTDGTKFFRMNTALDDSLALCICCSKPPWQIVFSTKVLDEINKAVGEIYPNDPNVPLLDVAGMQQAGIQAFKQIGVPVDTARLSNDEACKAYVQDHVPMKKMRLSKFNPEQEPPRQTDPAPKPGHTWRESRWIRPHGEGQVHDDVLRLGESFFSILPFTKVAAPYGCLHQHHRYVQLVDIYINDETQQEVHVCAPGALIMPHATTLLDVLEVHDIAFKLAVCTMNNHEQMFPPSDDGKPMLKVSISRDICSTRDVDMSNVSSARQDMIVAQWSGAPLQDVWGLPLDLGRQVGQVGQGTTGAGGMPGRPYGKMGSNALGWPVAHHEGTLEDADDPSFLSAIVTLTQEMDIRVWEYSQDLLSFMKQVHTEKPELRMTGVAEEEEAHWMRAHATEGSLVSRGVQMIATTMRLPSMYSFLYLPTLVIAESPLPSYCKQLRYKMHIQVYRRQHKDEIEHNPVHRLHHFVMQCCAKCEGTGTWDRNRLQIN